MATITEDYVSFETAKLLKEKGFDEECVYFYDWDEEDEIYRICSNGGSCNNKEYPTYYSRPTLQMAMKWLREVHNIALNIGWGEILEDKFQWWCIILNQKDGSILRESEYYSTYEQACEAAIEYCLEHLI